MFYLQMAFQVRSLVERCCTLTWSATGRTSTMASSPSQGASTASVVSAALPASHTFQSGLTSFGMKWTPIEVMVNVIIQLILSISKDGLAFVSHPKSLLCYEICQLEVITLSSTIKCTHSSSMISKICFVSESKLFFLHCYFVLFIVHTVKHMLVIRHLLTCDFFKKNQQYFDWFDCSSMWIFSNFWIILN